MMKRILSRWPAFLIIAAGIIIISLLFYKVHPQNNIHTIVSASDIRSSALKVADYLQYKWNKYQVIPTIKTNAEKIAEYQKKYGIEEGNKSVNKYEIPRYWEITWMKNSDIVFGGSDRQLEELKDFIGRLNIKYDLQGRLIGLNHGFPDTSKFKPISESEAFSIVNDFSSKFLGYINLSTIKLTEKRGFEVGPPRIDFKDKPDAPPPPVRERIDFTYTASYFDSLSGANKNISISITGSKVSLVKLLDNKVESSQLKDDDTIHKIINGIIIVATIILMIILLFKRFRAFELGYKHGLKLAIITAIFIGAEIFISTSGEFSSTIIIALVLGPIFSGLGVLIIWTITESIGREKWKDKFVSLDLMLKGYFRDSRIGLAMLNGIALGFLLNSVLLILYFLFEKIYPISIMSSSNDFLSQSQGAIKLFFNSLGSTIYIFITYVVFTSSYLKGKLKDIYIVILSGIILGLINTGFVSPDLIDILIQSAIGMIIIWFFLKTDILTTFIGAAAFYFIFRAVPLLMIPSVFYAQSIIVILFLFAGFLLWSIYAIITKDKALDFDSLTPAYAARITERERLKRELEIAEEVQLSFLPKEDPVCREILIASRCIPASEVGGDYYDYIKFDDNSIGIVIGDVSGKGIQASFYMTLVKGFLKAVAKQTSSTSGILNKLNELFCENVDKGNFITMVFAKFSLAEKRLIFSRAGHNPILIRHAAEKKTNSYQPKGFALGMEMTGQFPRFIEEENVQLNSGDLVVFYTDGITEAMNKKKEEYGTERLIHLLNELDNDTPEEVIDKVYKDVKNFIGRAPQHDDMTMVVVKVN